MTVYSSVVLFEWRKEQRSDTLRNKSHDVITHERLCKTTTPNTTIFIIDSILIGGEAEGLGPLVTSMV